MIGFTSGSLAGSGWQAIGGDFDKTGISMIAFSAVSGGIGAELTGGNFWTGAIIAGLNHISLFKAIQRSS